MDRGFLFLIISLALFWVVASEFVGDKYITRFVVGLIPDLAK